MQTTVEKGSTTARGERESERKERFLDAEAAFPPREPFPVACVRVHVSYITEREAFARLESIRGGGGGERGGGGPRGQAG